MLRPLQVGRSPVGNWADESERRFDAYLQGETTARDAKDMLPKHLKP
jgi:hypothetical protein